MPRTLFRWRSLLAILPLVAFACGEARIPPASNDAPSTGFGDGGGSAPPGETCAGASIGTAPVPLDLIFLLDRSASMSGKKWDMSARAILEFTRRGFPASTRAGLMYVPFRIADDHILGEDYNRACPEPLYHELSVPLGELPSNTRAIEDALGDPYVPPAGLGSTSPLYSALKGTYRIAAKEQAAHPDHQIVVVFVGDGEPTICVQYGADSTNSKVLAGLAASALLYNGVRTFAIVLQGAGGASTMSEIVAAGGGAAYMPDLDIDVDQLTSAVDRLTRSALDCTFAMPAPPAGQQLDLGRVNVTYTSGRTARKTIPSARESTRCAGEAGWYFDDAAGPSRITLCPATCADVRKDPLAKVEILLGCTTVVK